MFGRNKPRWPPIRPRSMRSLRPSPRRFGSRESIQVGEADKMQMFRIFIIGAAMLACTVIGIAQTSEPTPLTVPTRIPAQPAPALADVVKEQAELAANIKELEELKAQN